MDEAEMRAEIQLMAELQSMSAAIQRDATVCAAPTIWRLRRRQIAALRERIRTMRDQHLAEAHRRTAEHLSDLYEAAGRASSTSRGTSEVLRERHARVEQARQAPWSRWCVPALP
jgi:hypothetical protein